jgi:DNA-binding beta-propeller fold protein YncE
VHEGLQGRLEDSDDHRPRDERALRAERRQPHDRRARRDGLGSVGNSRVRTARYALSQPPPRYQRSRGGRSSRLPALLLVALVLALGAGLVVGVPRLLPKGGGSASAPAASTVHVTSATPGATITLGKLSRKDTLQTGTLKPGRYSVAVSRKGFKTATRTVVVRADRPTELRVALEPLPQRLSITTHPKSAAFTLVDSGKGSHSGKGSLRTSLPAGSLTVTLEAPGYTPLTRTVFLDGDTTLDLWLDPVGQVVHQLGVFKCVPAPKGVAVTPDGSQMWVTALVSKPSLEAYDRAGNVLGKVTLGSSGAVEVIFNRDGTRAYASQMQSASVFEIDTKTYKLLRTFKTGSSWTKVIVLSPDEKKLYAANWSGDDVSEIDLGTGKLLRRFPTVDTPRGLWPTADGKRLFVAGFGEQSFTGRLAVIDLATGKSQTFFTVKGGAMRHMVADEKRNLLLTSDMGKAVVWATDMTTLETKQWAKTDSHPNTIDMSPDGKVLFVSCRGANNPKSYNLPGPEWGSVLLFDTTTGKLLDAIVGGNQCTALDLSGDGRTLVFSDFLDARMHVYEIPPYATLVAGGGGRAQSHLADIRKPGWSRGSGSSGGGGD